MLVRSIGIGWVTGKFVDSWKFGRDGVELDG